jgi:1-acyl-sn-glycerol-3-phosphate acyltransferase
MSARSPVFYRICRWILRASLGFYFTRIERFHPERVPLSGPVLFTSNHPNSLTDAFVIGDSVERKVNFVATVQLFRFGLTRWLLKRCGVIPINRVKDDPRAMHTVKQSFEACFRVLEQGEAVAIFPEGNTHDDPQLKTVKTGAARMALELEHRHAGKLGLQIVPVGLTFSAKEIYRSAALVNFGEPIAATDFLSGYAEKRHECIHALTAEIERRIQGLILHLPDLERARVVAAVKRLYLERLRVGNTVIHEPVSPQTSDLLLTQAIAGAADRAFTLHPERASRFVHRLRHYERCLNRLRLSDDVLAQFPDQTRMLARSLVWAVLGVVGAPIALYGWVHRLIPYALVRLAVKKFARDATDKTHVSTATVLAGLVAFTLVYALYIGVFHAFFGWPASVWYALSLPVASLAAHYYAREMRRFATSLRAAGVLLGGPRAARRLVAERAALIALIEAERQELDAAAGAASAKG